MLPNSEDVVARFFTVLFGVVGPSQPHNIQMQILDILQLLIEEPKTVPQDVIDVILLQFTKKRQQDNPAAHQLASDLASGTADILQKYIYQYFNDVIVSAAQQRTEELRDLESEGQDQRGARGSGQSSALRDLRSAHLLILELNKSAPGTLLNVIPQLEEELGVDDVSIRLVTINALGEMFAEKGFTLAKRYESTWRAWKGRRADASPVARIAWIKNAMSLYQHQPQLARELSDFVVEKLRDVDEKVREAACHSLGQLEFTPSVQSAVAANVIEALGERCKDRKTGVRAEAIVSLATIYNQVYEELEQGNAGAARKFGSIPTAIMMLRYVKDVDIDSKVDSILSSAILNFSQIKDDRERCRRLLFVVDSLSAKARTGLLSYMQRQRALIYLTDHYLAQCEELDSSESGPEARIRGVAKKISDYFPDSTKMESALMQLALLRCNEAYKGLRETMSPSNDFKAVRKHQRTSLRKISTLAPNILDPTAPLWKAVGLTTFNRALTPFLIECASSDASGYSAAASSADPARFKAAAELLIGYIADAYPGLISESSLQALDVGALSTGDALDIDERLDLISKLAKSAPDALPRSAELQDRLVEFVRSGTLRQAMVSAYILTQMAGARAVLATLASELVSNLEDQSSGRRLPSLAALSKLVLHASDAFAPCDARAVPALLKIVQERLPGNDAGSKSAEGEHDEAEWAPLDSLGDACLTRIYAITTIANWVVTVKRDSSSLRSIPYAVAVLRRLVENRGNVYPDENARPRNRNHILLTAGACMLKLVELPHLERLIGAKDSLSLSLLVQDPCYEVRSKFLLEELIPALVSGSVSARYIATVFLVAHDPETELRDNVKHVVAFRLAGRRPAPGSPSLVESSFPRLLHLLVHHPDWDDAKPVETLELFAPYIEFFITCACSAQNVSLLYYFASELKAYRNKPAAARAAAADDDDASKVFTHRLYIVSELAQYLLREKSISANWPVNVYPGQLALPGDIFEPLSDSEKAAITRNPFLSSEFVSRRAKTPAASRAAAGKRGRSAANAGETPAKRRKSTDQLQGSASQKKKGSAKGKAGAKRKGKEADIDSDEEDEGDDIKSPSPVVSEVEDSEAEDSDGSE
ncbi:hypothetical protein GQ54DRAFT_295114 [Martensiomyces pterosporus]|nr:hypothetical protein GQ54DRAFT_295114 [Martensiomyces pterosporus]